MTELEMSEPKKDRELALQSTVTLLSEARAGNERAAEVLFERHRPRLQAYARHKLPRAARDLLDTEDLVQEACLRVLPHIRTFVPTRTGGFQAYLRKGLLHLIIDQSRRVRRRPAVERTPSRVADWRPSPLDEAISAEVAARYETALATLDSIDRSAIIARIEFGLSYKQIAETLGKNSDDAARMTTARALCRLAERMADEAHG